MNPNLTGSQVLERSKPLILDKSEPSKVSSGRCASSTSATGSSTVQTSITAPESNAVAANTVFKSLLGTLTPFDAGTWPGEPLSLGPPLAPGCVLFASLSTTSDIASYSTEFSSVTMPFFTSLTVPIPASFSVATLQQYSQQPAADGLQMANSQGATAQLTAQSFAALTASINTFTGALQSRFPISAGGVAAAVSAGAVTINNILNGFASDWSAVGIDTTQAFTWLQRDNLATAFWAFSPHPVPSPLIRYDTAITGAAVIIIAEGLISRSSGESTTANERRRDLGHPADFPTTLHADVEALAAAAWTKAQGP
ncbi:hypothetical protein DFH09DRAFT_1088962 [Mycena vulgaris]|nr:hypothetical protein DFH09DRAFT_1088962 [Mycena vulgaris]